MTRFLIPVLFWLSCIGAAQARCSGQDLSTSLLPQEQTIVDQRLAQMPYAEGNHWIARRDGEILHLIGTIHLGDPRMDGPTRRLSPLIDTASLLLLEMNQADQKRMEKSITSDPSILMLADSSLPDLLPAEDWQRLSTALDARGIPAFIGARMQPWYVSMMLSVPPCIKDQLQKKDGLDFRLEKHAMAQGVPTRSLEPFDTGFRLFAAIPLDLQLSLVRAALSSPDVNEDLFETLMSAYFAEDPARGQVVLEVLSPRLTPLDPHETEAIYRTMDEVTIAGRNRAWIPILIDSLSDTDGPVVAAFGAAHLSGENGVLNLLAQQGFVLERAPF